LLSKIRHQMVLLQHLVHLSPGKTHLTDCMLLYNLLGCMSLFVVMISTTVNIDMLIFVFINQTMF
jgi:hypothetical protein